MLDHAGPAHVVSVLDAMHAATRDPAFTPVTPARRIRHRRDPVPQLDTARREKLQDATRTPRLLVFLHNTERADKRALQASPAWPVRRNPARQATGYLPLP